MDWAVTSPPIRTIAQYNNTRHDVIAIRVPTGSEVDPDVVKTEFLLVGAQREPEWVPMNLISSAHAP